MSVNIPLSADINTSSFEMVKTYLNEIAKRAGMSAKEIEDMNKAIAASGTSSQKAAQQVEAGMKTVEQAASDSGSEVEGMNQAIADTGTKSKKAGQEAQAGLKTVEQAAARTEKEVEDLNQALGEGGAKSQKSSQEAQAGLKTVEQAASRSEKEVEDLSQALVDTGTKGKKASQEVQVGLKDVEQSATRTEKKIEDLNDEVEDTGKKTKKAGQEAQGSLKGLERMANSAGAALVAAFSVQLVMNFQKAVLATTGEFQKMEAVLTNTLGSDSAAQLAMAQLMDFASKTPFAVDELTGAFIKLTNQGFQPTLEEMRKLGDLASSTGKTFDQLAEAIIDGQVGEFERLKEFGIRAKQEGDKVTFTFKGVATEVERTEKAMRAYLVSLGDVEGVSGSMAAISDTVAGKLSNMEDNITQLHKAIGDRQSGIYADSLDWLNSFLELATLSVQSLRDLKESARQITMADNVSETRKEVDFLITRFGAQLSTQEAINKAIDLTIQSYRDLSDNIDGDITAGKLWKQVEALEQYRKELLANAQAEQDKADSDAKAVQDKLDKEAQARAQAEAAKRAAEKARIDSLGMIAKIEHEITEAQKARKQADSVEEVSRIDARIEALQKELALINLMAKGIHVQSRNPFDGIDEEVKKSLDKMNDNAKKAFEKSIDDAKAWAEQSKEVTRRAAEFWRDFQHEASYAVLDTYLNIEERGAQNTQVELERLEQEKQAKLLLAGQDAEQRLVIEEEYAARKEELRQKEKGRMIREAIAQRALSVFNIIQSSLQGATAALAPPPIGLGPIAGAPVAMGIKVLGALNVAAALSAPLPKFKDGVFDLKGSGTSTSDSIHAMLSRGESVVHAEGTNRFKDIIKPIIEDRSMNYEKLMGIIMDKVPLRLRGDVMNPREKRPVINEKYLVEGIVSGLGKVIKNKKETTIHIDRSGVSQREKRRGIVVKQMQNFLYD